MGPLSTISPMRHAGRLFRNALRDGAQTLLWASMALPCGAQATIQATSSLAVPLLLPTSVAFDGQGNLFLTETNGHVVRRVDVAGAITTVAGDGTQGFSGDGGLATAAQLDSPAGVAVDAANNLYVADTHNQRIRRVDAATGILTTVAGTGVAGFAGDGGAATLARLNLPTALAVDGSGNLWIADANNHRIRKVTASTGVISTVAGSGAQGFGGDGGAATAASLDSPGGLAVDAAGNLYLADSRNHRVRVVRAATGLIATIAGTGAAGFGGDNGAAASAMLAMPRGVSVDATGNVTVVDTDNQRVRRISAQGVMMTVAGDGTQAFTGDGGPAISASLDTPRGMALSPVGLVTVADTGNQRVRQVAANANIATVAGQGALLAGTLTLAAPGTNTYGSGSVTASLAASTPATGSVTFFESGGSSGTSALGSGVLAGGTATVSTAGLSAGQHSLFATYAGDLTHAPAQSAAMLLTVLPAPVTATAASVNIVYGQAVPVLAGTLSGVLPRDAGKVSLTLNTAAAALSPAGTYPIGGGLTGAAAGNYALAPLSGAAVTIAKAPSRATLAAGSLTAVPGDVIILTMHVASTTSGTPTGMVALLDGGSPLATLPLSATGDASYTSSTLGVGTHTLTAVYAGDGNFTGSTADGQSVTVTAVVPADFTLAATGPTTQTVTAGSAVTFPFTVQMQGTALSSPITLAASSLPAGTTASFSPAFLPPGGAVTAFTLTVTTPKAVTASLERKAALGFALLLLPWLGVAARGRRALAGALCLGMLISTTGCGARVFAVGASASLGKSYPITVTGTATSPSGGALVHSVVVTLTIE